MTGGSPYLATDTRALAKRFQNILEELESRASAIAACSMPSSTALSLAGLRVLLLEIACACPPAEAAVNRVGAGELPLRGRRTNPPCPTPRASRAPSLLAADHRARPSEASGWVWAWWAEGMEPF